MKIAPEYITNVFIDYLSTDDFGGRLHSMIGNKINVRENEMQKMQLSSRGLALIKEFEGCRLTAYQDSVGVWTIGYGWTRPVDGKPIESGMTIDQATADRLLKTGLVGYENDVLNLVKVKLTQNQFDALVSFTYNLGAHALSTSTLLKKLNAGDYSGAADEFLRWDKAGGKVLPGLVKRREAEKQLFQSS